MWGGGGGGGKLVGERMRRPLKVKATELLFADDAAAASVDRNTMERAAVELEKVIKAWGLTLSVRKTKLLVAGALGTEDEARPDNAGRWRSGMCNNG